MVDVGKGAFAVGHAKRIMHGRGYRFTGLNTPKEWARVVCGIIGCVAEEPVTGILIDGLRKVEYRGYDSAGMATISERVLNVRKGAGRVSEIEAKHQLSGLKGSIGLAHTRWATHGGVTDQNAHPQTSCKELVAVVHNGIIENYLPLKKELASRGHRFRSETDTEVIAHLIEREYKKAKDPLKATVAATKKLKGQYAIAVMFQDSPDV
jgi:glucosamine--fructose-6-phosphate aminotransferase (isomerizing)